MIMILSSLDKQIFAYDEEVERNIRVNYTVLPTYDSKKQRLTEKAILVTIDDSDYDFINR